MITISRPSLTDSKQINGLIKAAWYATYPDKQVGITKEDIDLMYAESEESQIKALEYRSGDPKDNDISMVAKTDRQVVGYIRFKIQPESVEFLSLYVHPEHLGKGIGTTMWNTALTLLPKTLPINVEVASYTKAIDFYRKIGFVETGERYLYSEPMKSSGALMPLVKMVFTK